MLRYTLETLPDGDVRVTQDSGPANDPLVIVRVYTVRRGQIYIRLAGGSVTPVSTGLQGFERRVDIVPGASLEQALLGLL